MRRARTRLAAPLAGLLVFGLGGCIIRPEGSEASRAHFDRRHLGNVLLAASPEGLTGGGALYDDGIRFDGYTLAPPSLESGRVSVLTLYWSATADPIQRWRVFVHLDPVGGEGNRVNYDHQPAGGRYPTNDWQKGDVVRDRVRIDLPTWAVARAYQLWVGFYQGNQRLDIVNAGQVRTDGQNRAFAGVIPVE